MHERPSLAPPAYLCLVRDYLRKHERELWAWFSAAQARVDYANALKLSLLKSTYRLTPADHPELYRLLDAARTALGINAPAAMYQAQSGSSQPNASLFHLPDEVHIVLSGPLLSLLNPVETQAVLGHELAHRLLWLADDGDFLIAERILESAVRDDRGGAAQVETARRFRLHTEIFADRGALHASGDLPQTVAALVKISNGLSASRGESYLAQAAEIFAQGKIQTDALTHPEMFLRAHALALWADRNETVDTQLQAVLRGAASRSTLDLLDQERATSLTRRFLGQVLRPAWFRSDAVLAQACLYFPDFAPAEADDPDLKNALMGEADLLPGYFAYVLLDFVRVDPDLEEMPLAATLIWADDLGIAEPFEKHLAKELGIKPKDIARVRTKAAEMLGAAASRHG